MICDDARALREAVNAELAVVGRVLAEHERRGDDMIKMCAVADQEMLARLDAAIRRIEQLELGMARQAQHSAQNERIGPGLWNPRPRTPPGVPETSCVRCGGHKPVNRVENCDLCRVELLTRVEP